MVLYSRYTHRNVTETLPPPERCSPYIVIPPLLANTTVGAILYTSYLQVLGAVYGPSSQQTKRVYPPPPFTSCFEAGFVAGGIQSLVAAPLDALVVRFEVNDMLEGRYKSMWQYGRHKLHEIGMKGVFKGYGLSFWKESLGYGLFFGSFEYVKQQAYFSYLKWYYGWKSYGRERTRGTDREFIRPHFALEPCFLLLAGVSASVSQQLVQYPFSKIQDVYHGRLESIDYASKLEHTSAPKAYAHSYEKTWSQLRIQASQVGGWRKWLYRGFIINTLRQVPSTSAGLIVFELMRRRFGESRESVAIEHENLTILLS